MSEIDIKGNIVENLSNSLSGGFDNFEIELDNYISGAYVYSIVADGIQFKTGKFVILR